MKRLYLPLLVQHTAVADLPKTLHKEQTQKYLITLLLPGGMNIYYVKSFSWDNNNYTSGDKFYAWKGGCIKGSNGSQCFEWEATVAHCGWVGRGCVKLTFTKVTFQIPSKPLPTLHWQWAHRWLHNTHLQRHAPVNKMICIFQRGFVVTFFATLINILKEHIWSRRAQGKTWPKFL